MMLEESDQSDSSDSPSLQALILRFIRVICLCWAEIVAAVPTDNKQDTLNDWLQFHWELLVEWPLRLQKPGLILTTYGEGAETSSGRISDTEEVAIHQICCRPLSGACLSEMIDNGSIEFPPSGFPIEEFVGCESGQWHRAEPPFNAVLVSSHEHAAEGPGVLPLVFNLDEVEFVLQPLEPT